MYYNQFFTFPCYPKCVVINIATNIFWEYMKYRLEIMAQNIVVNTFRKEHSTLLKHRRWRKPEAFGIDCGIERID